MRSLPQRWMFAACLAIQLVFPDCRVLAQQSRASVTESINEKSARAVAADKNVPALFPERWVYCSSNMLVDRNVERLIELIRRAAASGYTGLMLADYKFQILDRMDDRYFRNAARVRAAAERERLELIPAVFSVGYSNGILAHDPNLAEGILADRIPHLVQGREAVLRPLAAAILPNGDFERADAHRFQDFSFQDDPGHGTFADDQVAHSGRRSCRIEPIQDQDGTRNLRVMRRIKVRRRACYRLSCWVKTSDLSSTDGFRLMVLGAGASGRQLTFGEEGLKSTTDWIRKDIVFNTLDHDEINVYAGFWGAGRGKLWIDDLMLDELSLVNVLRRDGCPLRVTSADEKTVYVEGEDFEPVADPKLGRVPYDGEFEFGHPGPRIRLRAGGGIRPGETLLVSWYHPVLTHGEQVMCCLSEPKVEAILKDQARRVNELFHPKSFFMSHDEIRVANWCDACRTRGLTPGQLLAENARRCQAILKALNPTARVAVWSDMFDPQHNAVARYYLVNGTLEGSWEGLSRDTIVANWNSGGARRSLAWFAARGHRQIIAGYYDDDDRSSFLRWQAAARGVEGIVGFMYTTWSARYGMLERYGADLRNAR